MNLGVKQRSLTSSSASWKSADGVSDQFPVGLRVLVVDDDPTCLRILEKMLRNCLYEVTKCNRAETALNLLRDNKNGYDIVISDVHMPDMDGFKLLECVGLEMDLPVIMMSADDSKNVVMKGVTHGACDYLIKPVRMEALKNIWQHVVRKMKHEWKEKDFEPSESMEDGERQQKLQEDLDYSSSANEGSWRNSKKRKNEEDEADERDDTSTLKKPRVVWSVELHQQFVTAVNQLGIDKAVPKKILELMNVPGLTRENVASHLQKYRLYLRRLSGASPHHNGLGNSFMEHPPDTAFGPISSLNGLDLQALAASGQLPPQSLATIQVAALGRSTSKSAIPIPVVDQRNIFSFDNPKLRFVEGQQSQSNNGKQVNLLHGIPTNMDSKKLATLHQSVQSYGNVNMHIPSPPSQHNPLLSQMVQPQSRNRILNESNGSHASNLPPSVGPSQAIPSAISSQIGIENVQGPGYTSVVQPAAAVDFSRAQSGELSGNSSSLASGSGMSTVSSKLPEEPNTEMKGGSRAFVPNYGVFDELNQNRQQAWSSQQHVGSRFEGQRHSNIQGGLDFSPSVIVQPGFSSNQRIAQSRVPPVNKTAFSVPGGAFCKPNISQQLNSSLADSSLRIKAERLPDMGFHNGIYPEHFCQDDLMSALIIKQQQEGLGHVENEYGFDGYHLDNLPVQNR